MAGVVWRRGMALRLRLDPASAHVEAMTTRHLGLIASAALSLPPAQRDQFFAYVGRELRTRVPGRDITDLDIDAAIRVALAQAAA
jgi:hypothetical protein